MTENWMAKLELDGIACVPAIVSPSEVDDLIRHLTPLVGDAGGLDWALGFKVEATPRAVGP